MLTLGDGIAIAGLLGVVMTALIIWNSRRGGDLEGVYTRRSTNGYVRTSTCEAVKADIKGQLSDLKAGNEKLFSKMDALDSYIRERGVGRDIVEGM